MSLTIKITGKPNHIDCLLPFPTTNLVQMKKIFVCGFNGFQQFGQMPAKEIRAPTEILFDFPFDEKLFDCSWSANAYACENKLILKGFVKNKHNNTEKFEFSSNIKQLSLGDTFCLVLLTNGDVLKINLRVGTVDKLNFLNIERSTVRKSIFGNSQEVEHSHRVAMIAVASLFSVAITQDNVVYNIPTKIYEFPKHVKIKSLKCGFEHALLLTTNGDVYSWGSALRGQLGHADFESREVPTLIEALSGIKIVCIGANGWHSAAVSAFGDLYVWGMNVDGQLGIKIYEPITDDTPQKIKRKNPAVYPLPKLIDLPPCCEGRSEDDEGSCDVLAVVCGNRHTFVKKVCGRIFCAGWNEYGQLGLDRNNVNEDQFLLVDKFNNDMNIYCGSWSTIFVET